MYFLHFLGGRGVLQTQITASHCPSWIVTSRAVLSTLLTAFRLSSSCAVCYSPRRICTRLVDGAGHGAARGTDLHDRFTAQAAEDAGALQRGAMPVSPGNDAQGEGLDFPVHARRYGARDGVGTVPRSIA